MRSAGRGPRTRRWTSEPPTPDQAAAAVVAARQHLDRVSDAVAAGCDGAASLNAAEHTLHVTLNRYEAARDQETTA